MDDLERLLATNENWMLGPWLERAKFWGKLEDNKNDWVWEFNARNQITLWGPKVIQNIFTEFS